MTEEATHNFYQWEQRGRGWDVWGYPITIEPPFVPFQYYYNQPDNYIDDGRKPTIMSIFADKIKKIVQKPASPILPNSFPRISYEVEPDKFNCNENIVELKITLPQNYKIHPDFMEQCILNIASTTSIISFEILGSSDSIIVQVSCRSSDVSNVKQQICAYFPGAILSENINSLESLKNSVNETVVVDFGLSEEFMCPLRTYRSFDIDPLIGVFGAMENVLRDEIGLVQILFKPVSSPWAESIIRSVTDFNGDSFFADSPEMVSLAHDKVNSPLFAVVMRVVGQGRSITRAWEIVRSLAGCFSAFSDPQSNELIPLENFEYDNLSHVDDVVKRQAHRSGMILNSKELVSLAHFPSQVIVSKKLLSQSIKTNLVPASATGNDFLLGQNVHNGIENTVSLTHEQRLRHMHVLGATGTGKSTLLLNLIMQDIEKNIGCAVIDPHGDLIESVLERIPQNRHEDVIVFDPADEEYAVGFNILKSRSEAEKNVLESDLVDIFRRFSTSWGDQMSVVLGNTISAFLYTEYGGTLLELRRFLIEKDYRNACLENVYDEQTKYFWEKEFPLLKGTSVASILTRLDFFLRPILIRNIVGQYKGLDLEDVINNQKILLIKLSQGIIGDENSYLLGSLLVSKLHQVVMQRQNMLSHERKPFYVYIDEFQNFITPSLKSMLSGSRKYHLGLILAHQDLHQLFDTDASLANSVISNVGTRICFRIGDFDAQKLQLGFAHFEPGDLQNLSIGESIVRIDRSDFDFNMKTNVPFPIGSTVAQNNKDHIIELSRVRYGKPFIERRKYPGVPPIFTVPPFIPDQRATTFKHKSDEKRNETLSQPKIPDEQINISYHRYLQTLIKKLAEQRGYKATIEESVFKGSGRVDVGLERNGVKIACEISITTNNEHEIQNVEKCLNAGYEKILVCAQDKKRIESLKKSFSSILSETEMPKIYFFIPEDLFLFFESETNKDNVKNGEKVVKGYRVKVEYNKLSDPEIKRKRDAVSDVIARSLQRINKGF